MYFSSLLSICLQSIFFVVLSLFLLLFLLLVECCLVFGVLCVDAIPWAVMEVFKLTEETTTSSGRIFIKILFQDLSENLGVRVLNDRLQSEDIKPYVAVRDFFLFLSFAS